MTQVVTLDEIPEFCPLSAFFLSLENVEKLIVAYLVNPGPIRVAFEPVVAPGGLPDRYTKSPDPVDPPGPRVGVFDPELCKRATVYFGEPVNPLIGSCILFILVEEPYKCRIKNYAKCELC